MAECRRHSGHTPFCSNLCVDVGLGMNLLTKSSDQEGQGPMLLMTIHQSMHNKHDRIHLACYSIDSTRFHISCPWFRSSQLRAQSSACSVHLVADNKHHRVKTDKQVSSLETHCLLMKLLPTFSFPTPPSFAEHSLGSRYSTLRPCLDRQWLAEVHPCRTLGLCRAAFLECLPSWSLAMAFLNMQILSPAGSYLESCFQTVLAYAFIMTRAFMLA
jgi:hypothetical protein